ncbi:fructose/tagatose bisphosphate aldolase [Deinococcus metalli]|uniref:Fructose-bisphosphate aldolase n=1 Tax=Deinococcus metalli TaxID=1141878 RepID=A0A7W8KCI2_9DEIO|nr:class II fructose-bisphosphate aldolase [Deinococcus metalli]MBB5375685.1 fructose/tagatose bisphosphate aldolase [Deinococcus metalli]GHF37788.1 fructose-bisphosphate aldolase [Deinococcus metalli]
MTWYADARPLYAAALAGGYALPAYNVCSLEMARGCVEAAEAAGRPVILQTYPADLAQASPHVFAQMVRALADEVRVPVALHLDHGRDVDQVVACLRAGYGSVMFDGQGLPFEETRRVTAHLAVIARACGAALEVSAEGFGLPGADDNVLDTTDPDQARALRDAGADLIACAVGSEHGHASRLDLGLLRRIGERVGGPLVLHGGSGIDPADLRAAVAAGVTKVNIGSALYRAVRTAWAASPGLPTHRAGYAAIRAAVRDAAAPYLDFLHPQGHDHD